MMSFRDHWLLVTWMRSSDPFKPLGTQYALLSCLANWLWFLAEAALGHWPLELGRCVGLTLLLVHLSV